MNLSKNKLTISLTFISIGLTVLLGLYPSILSTEYGKLNPNTYEQYYKLLSPDTKKFIEANLYKKFHNPKVFLKSIPVSISEKDRNRILDIFEYKINFAKAHNTLILLLFFMAIVFIAGREFLSARKYAIAHSVHFLHKAIHELRNNWDLIFFRHNGQLEIMKESAKKHLELSLKEVEKFFSTISGAPCRAWIKVPITPLSYSNGQLISEKDDVEVKTFARSSMPKVKKNEDNHLIQNNSDFYTIAVQQKPYYYKPNVDKGPYSNSRTDIASDKKFSEQLEYRSTLTFGTSSITDEAYHLYGFLCIDSQVTGVFKPRTDCEAGYLLADFFSLFLKKYAVIGQKLGNS